ncbi:MAG TPA: sulfurtransferase [Burkholderiaceae bacterium]|nr:sulfurtransferase [Burkholderiaceae bacterium]
MQTLISAESLDALIASGRPVVLLDCRFDLAAPDAGARAYEEGHLPGAHYVDLERDLSGPKHDAEGRFRGRHPLPDGTAFAETVGRWGIGPSTAAVVYDAHGGMFAARAWWMLRWLGHREVALLDGGLKAWIAKGGKLEAGTPHSPGESRPYPMQPDAMPTVEAAAVLQGLGRMKVIDARAPERYRGEVEPLDKAAGHIPGALNRFFQLNLQPDGRFKPAEALRAEFDALIAGRLPGEVVHQCGSGATACHNLLAMEHAGLAGSLLYPGSWSEWSSDPTRPVAQG